VRFPRPQKYDREPDEASQFGVSGIEDAGAQTISLQEEPLPEISISAEEPHAQTGLRSGKLARIVHEARRECRTIGFFEAASTS